MLRTILAFCLLALPAAAQTKIVFGTDWLAEAEHGSASTRSTGWT